MPEKSQDTAPSISLPKGGSAIRGIGEKFAAHPVTGTGSTSVPIATSPGRLGFEPQLTLTYNSDSGNVTFGFGWQLSLPHISRKTEKGLPQYRDSENSDVCILSNVEDLVPVLRNVNGKYEPYEEHRTVVDINYRINRYRPRIEGLFACIERWTSLQSGELFWRSVSKEREHTV
jgi:hypothetical protein